MVVITKFEQKLPTNQRQKYQEYKTISLKNFSEENMVKKIETELDKEITMMVQEEDIQKEWQQIKKTVQESLQYVRCSDLKKKAQIVIFGRLVEANGETKLYKSNTHEGTN